MTYLLAQSVDPSAGGLERSDFFAIATACADFSTRRFHILDIFKARIDITEQTHAVEREWRKWADAGPFAGVWIESIFFQSSLFKHLWQERIVPVKELPRRSGSGNRSMNKYMRLLGLAGRYERGDILHPGRLVDGVWMADYGRNPWLEGYEAELLGLTEAGIVGNTAHDDAADAAAACIEVLAAKMRGMSATRESPIWHTVQWGGGSP